jgi:NAD(P)-dependent dehydrogenase (short-subunit alcohol dehydrogenase family)
MRAFSHSCVPDWNKLLFLDPTTSKCQAIAKVPYALKRQDLRSRQTADAVGCCNANAGIVGASGSAKIPLYQHADARHRRIRVNVLSPGQILTPIQEQLFDAATMKRFESLIPRGRMGSPDEIATVALFLACDDSSYVNGVELSVDGGTSAI